MTIGLQRQVGDAVAIDGRGEVCVLMSTYGGETPQNLSESLESLSAQTRRPDAIVLVIDGPIDPHQERLIATFQASRPRVDVIRRRKRGGLARALNDALAACPCEYAMRMDSDDLCAPDRVAIQMEYISRHPEIDLLGSWAEEFYGDGIASALKASPCDHENVARALRWRNVLVHPSIVMRTVAARAIGGYRDRYGYLEDYDLFVRLVVAGGLIHVIPKALVRIRCTLGQNTRRGGLTYVRSEIRFRLECLRIGFMTLSEFLIVTALYTIFRVLTGSMRRQLSVLVRS